MEKPLRSLAKAVSWRIVATFTTFILSFMFTGNIIISGSIGVSELVVKTIVYFLHERVWNVLNFGKERK